jgi:phospholipid/cholesterol/gamma-HCH transport system permease protein
MMIMLPVLTVFGTYIGMLGGWAICHFSLDMTTAGYVLRAIEAAHLGDLYSGLCKSVVFAWLIVTIAAHAGLKVEGGAEGVGTATTLSVVRSLLAILIANAILTALFFFL